MTLSRITEAQRYRFTSRTNGDSIPALAVDVNPIVDAVNDILDGTTSLTEVEVGNGSVSAPSMTFTSDPDTGLYRIGANNLGVAASGAKVLDVATTGLGVTGVVNATSASTTSLAVGLTGATNSAFVVDSSTALQAAGLKVTGAIAAGTVAAAVISSGADASLTVNAKGTGTIGIGTVSTGAVTIAPATTVTGAITPTGGVAAAGGFSVSPRNIAIGGLVPAVSTDFTDATPVNTEVYIGEVFVPANCTITGVAVFNGSNVTDNIKVGLANSAGVVVATSISTAGAGADAYQRVPFTGTYAAKGPATYYILSMYAASTSRYNAPPLGSFGASKQTGQVFATGFTTITPPTTFTANLCNIASLY